VAISCAVTPGRSDLLRRDPRSEELAGPVHPDAGDPLRLGQGSDLPGILDHAERIHDRIRGDDLDLGVDLSEEVHEEGRRVEPHLDPDPQPSGIPGRDARGLGLGDQLAEAAHDVVDLAAYGSEHPHTTVSQSRPQLGLLAREGDELRRALEGDERPRLPAILAEEVAVVVVIEDDDGDEALLAHALLDASDALVLDVHRDRPWRAFMCHIIRWVLSSCPSRLSQDVAPV
jgi:hypothetical protein